MSKYQHPRVVAYILRNLPLHIEGSSLRHRSYSEQQYLLSAAEQLEKSEDKSLSEFFRNQRDGDVWLHFCWGLGMRSDSHLNWVERKLADLTKQSRVEVAKCHNCNNGVVARRSAKGLNWLCFADDRYREIPESFSIMRCDLCDDYCTTPEEEDQIEKLVMETAQ